jgi:hypothetical protein
MHALLVIGVLAWIWHALCHDSTFVFLYLLILGGWTLAYYKLQVPKENPKRKVIMAAMWDGKKPRQNPYNFRGS